MNPKSIGPRAASLGFLGVVTDLHKVSRMSEVAGTLGNESRLILMLLIADGEKSVEILAELSGIPVASTSQHLQVLKKSNMVATRRDGKRVLYRLQNGPIREVIEALERFAVFRDLSGAVETDAGQGITPKELEKKLKSGKIMLIDVRSPGEFHKEHIPGAVNMPFEDLKKHTGRLPRNRDLIVYCRGPFCLLSVNAVTLLRSKGIAAVRLTSGLSEWPGDREGSKEQ